MSDPRHHDDLDIVDDLDAVGRKVPVVIALIVGVAMSLALIGLIVAIPWLAHASWHAYRDLAGRE